MRTNESAALPVPGSEADLTAAWITAAIRGGEAAAAPPGPIERTRIGIGYGLASEIYRVSLRDPGLPESVIVKLWDTDGPGGIHEVSFYQTFGGDSALPIPRCYFGAIDGAAHRGVLVLEDRRAAVQGDCLAVIDPSHAAALSRLVARFHARWWADEGLAAVPWLRSDRTRTHDPEWFASRGTEFRARFGGRLDPRHLAWLEDAPALEQRANDLLDEWPDTLLHADLHLDNVLFEDGDGEPVLLDWASAGSGPAVLDLGDIVFLMGRHDDHAPIVSTYVSALGRHGVPPVDEARLRRGLTGALLRRFVRTTLGVVRWRTKSAREEAIVVAGIDRIQRAAIAWERRYPECFSG